MTTVNPLLPRRPLGLTGLRVTPIAIGTSALGGMARTYGYDVAEEDAVATIEAALTSPVNFIDTANEYGSGASEERIGKALARSPATDGVVLASKADPLPGGPFDASRVLESFAESTARLGVERVKLFYLHDPDRYDFADIAAPNGALSGMERLRAEGLVDSIGVAGGDVDEMQSYVDTGAFDVVLNHNRYTLLDRSAEPLIRHAADAGMAFVNAAPYGSGILAGSSERQPRYRYRPAGDEVVATTERLRNLCRRFDTDLAAVALQFSTRDPRIASTVVGVSRPGRIRQLIANATIPIPEEVWSELDDLTTELGILH